ncbi:phage/plasmid replication protein, II/X family, partial [Ventosimonas gracilis]|uniref:phage/plasmid replication protein, II/X family n=1 Tax=Ventosimonas gracilis TaxID=1680762 RepID=UPI001EFBDA7D
GRPDYSAPPLASHLYIHGNPAKWLQGHNFVGTDNLLELMFDTFDALCSSLNLTPTDFERHHIKKGQYRLTRLDYNRMYELPSRSDVQGWLRAAEFKAKSRHGRPMYNRGTLTFGGTSTHWKVVCYCKADEMHAKRSSKVPAEEKQLTSDPELKRWIDNKLRVELRLLSRKLKDT